MKCVVWFLLVIMICTTHVLPFFMRRQEVRASVEFRTELDDVLMVVNMMPVHQGWV